jgi:hypothetical protein
MYRFWVVAPLALKTAAFKEDGRANAWSIMYRESFDIKNPPCHKLFLKSM